MKIKTTMNYHHTLFATKTKTVTTPNTGENVITHTPVEGM